MGVLGTVNNNVNSISRSAVTAAEPPCQCSVDHFLAPLKFKMKGLKKIRKKIGLGRCLQEKKKIIN